jgi:serine/threonine-protein kinase
MTQTGTVLGTSDYIAPEQAQGQRVDDHTDIYSLGVVLYELLTNQVPFPGENFVAVAMRHINEPPPPIRDKRPDVPPRVEAAIHKAMAKNPDDRWPTMADFCRELDACLAELQGTQVAPAIVASQPAEAPAVAAPRQRRRGVSPWPLILFLAAVLAIAAVVAFLLLHKHHTSHHATTLPPTGGGSIHLTAIAPYDPPPGDGHEDNVYIPRATDGNPDTAWSTEHYYNHPSLNKPGVGLVLDAGSPVKLSQLGISTDTPGFQATIKAGPSATSFPTVVSPSATVAGTHIYTISGGPYRYYLIWITRLGGNYDHADVNDVKAKRG